MHKINKILVLILYKEFPCSFEEKAKYAPPQKKISKNKSVSLVAQIRKNLPAISKGYPSSIPGLGISWRREWLSIPLFFPGESHGPRGLASYSAWGCKKSDMTKNLITHTQSAWISRERRYTNGQ